MVKEFGLMVFMAGVGLSAGSGLQHGLGSAGALMLLSGLLVSLLPVVICYLFGAYVLRMNRALLFAHHGRAPAHRPWRSSAIPRAAAFRRSAMPAPTPLPTSC